MQGGGAGGLSRLLGKPLIFTAERKARLLKTQGGRAPSIPSPSHSFSGNLPWKNANSSVPR